MPSARKGGFKNTFYPQQTFTASRQQFFWLKAVMVKVEQKVQLSQCILIGCGYIGSSVCAYVYFTIQSNCSSDTVDGMTEKELFPSLGRSVGRSVKMRRDTSRSFSAG